MDINAQYAAAIAERTAAKERGDRAAYQAAAARCGELARALREAEAPAVQADIAARAAQVAAAQRERDEIAALRQQVRRAWTKWHSAQEWPRCGQGYPKCWTDMLPRRVRQHPLAAQIIEELDA